MALTLTRADLERLGIKPATRFTLQGEGGVADVLWGTNFSDVPAGAWVAFEDAEGWMEAARNGENAAAALHVSQGAELEVRR